MMFMVASKQQPARFIAPPDAVLTGESRLWKFTRDDAAALVRMGIVPEDASTELLNGVIVHTDRAARGEDVLRIGRNHVITVERFSNLREVINSPILHVQCQQPLACGEFHEPQPDFMVVDGQLEDYDDGPTAADVHCVVEVAESSYERDSGEKLIGYARAGIAQYIIINLRNRTAEVYENPDAATGTYPPPQIILADGTLILHAGESEFAVQLAGMLP